MASIAAFQALLQRLPTLPEDEMDELINSTQGAISIPPIPTIGAQASQNNTILGTTLLGTILMTPGTAGTSSLSSSSTTTSSPTAVAADAAPAVVLPPCPTSPPGPKNPYRVGALNHWSFTLPDITLTTLRPFTEFHQGDFTEVGVKTKIHNLVLQLSCHTFATI